jgi:hypothetical protein
MTCAEYTDMIINIIFTAADRISESPIQIVMKSLNNTNLESTYIYSTDTNSNIIKFLAYSTIQNSYGTWLASGGGDSAFLSILSEFICHLCGTSAELYFNAILEMMGVPVNDRGTK